MTPEETKEYIDHRLQELGLQVQLDTAGYDKIFSFTNGTESGANKICYKLVSLCSDDDTRAISGETLVTAIDELAHVEELMKRTAKTASRKHNEELDRASIEQLAAVLEANAEAGDLELRPMPGPSVAAAAVARTPPAAKPGGNGAHRPKVLIVNDSQTRRSMVANVLAKNFTCVEAADAERAWKVLAEQRDIDMVVTDLQGHNRNGYDLIAGIRSAAAPSYLVGIPIIAIAATDDAAVRQRARAAGANDVIPVNTDAGELESRVYARYKSIRGQPRVPAAPATRAKPAVPRPQSGAAAREPQPLGPPFGKPRNTPRPLDPARLSAMTRPFMSHSGAASAGFPEAFIRRLHRISATTTITLSATVLVIVALTIILYANRVDYDGASVGNVPPAARLAERDTGTRLPPAPALEPEVKQEAPAAVPNGAGTPEAEASAEPPPAAPSRPTLEKQQSSAAAGASSAEAAPKERDAAPLARDEPVTRGQDRSAAREPPRIASAPPEGGGARSPMEDQTPDRGAPAAQPPATGSAAPAPETVPESATAPPLPEPAKPLLSQDDLAGLLKRFVFVYEAGDIDQFMNLFAPSARTNDRANRNGIREDYENLFRATDLRLMKLSYVNWEVDNNRAQGWGNFEVAVRRAGEQQVHDYQGSITLYVEKIDGRPRIVRLYHGQRRAEK